jgi:hypothetical protein
MKAFSIFDDSSVCGDRLLLRKLHMKLK